MTFDFFRTVLAVLGSIVQFQDDFLRTLDCLVDCFGSLEISRQIQDYFLRTRFGRLGSLRTFDCSATVLCLGYWLLCNLRMTFDFLSHWFDCC